jgi:hypothetical protein
MNFMLLALWMKLWRKYAAAYFLYTLWGGGGRGENGGWGLDGLMGFLATL